MSSDLTTALDAVGDRIAGERLVLGGISTAVGSLLSTEDRFGLEIHQIPHRHLEPLGDPLDCFQSRISLPRLQLAQIRAAYFAPVRCLVLRQASLLAQLSKVTAKSAFNRGRRHPQKMLEIDTAVG